MQERNIGYGLLSSGLLVMIISVLVVIFVFTGTIKPISLFNITAPTLDASKFMPQIPGLPPAPSNPMEIIQTKDFNYMLNVGATVFLMGFILSFGFKLADLGVKLIRPIKIEAKA